MKTDNPDSHINLLWTGGWDSTFRLLHLILVEKKRVQPYYVVDHERKSTEYEFLAMEKIKNKLFLQSPESKELVLPTIIGYRNEVIPNEKITRKAQQLWDEVKLGHQYEWLPLFAKQNGLHDLEMCHEKKPSPSLFDLLLYPELVGEGHDCRINDTVKNDLLEIFKYFRFPICQIEKKEMEQISKQYGFFKLLQNSWFCHSPKKNGVPCETCNPCLAARKAGYSHGLPKTKFLKRKYCYLTSKLWNIKNRLGRRFRSNAA